MPAPPAGGSAAPLPPPPPGAGQVVGAVQDAGQGAVYAAKSTTDAGAESAKNVVDAVVQGAQEVVNFVASESRSQATAAGTQAGQLGRAARESFTAGTQVAVATAQDTFRQGGVSGGQQAAGAGNAISNAIQNVGDQVVTDLMGQLQSALQNLQNLPADPALARQIREKAQADIARIGNGLAALKDSGLPLGSQSDARLAIGLAVVFAVAGGVTLGPLGAAGGAVLGLIVAQAISDPDSLGGLATPSSIESISRGGDEARRVAATILNGAAENLASQGKLTADQARQLASALTQTVVATAGKIDSDAGEISRKGKQRAEQEAAPAAAEANRLAAEVVEKALNATNSAETIRGAGNTSAGERSTPEDVLMALILGGPGAGLKTLTTSMKEGFKEGDNGRFLQEVLVALREGGPQAAWLILRDALSPEFAKLSNRQFVLNVLAALLRRDDQAAFELMLADGGDGTNREAGQYTSRETVVVLEGEVEVIGRGRVKQGEMLANAGGPVRMANLPDMPVVKVDPDLFRETSKPVEEGLYVWVRDGAVQVVKDDKLVEVSAGNAAVATKDRITLLDVVPNFLRFDQTPRPAPSGGELVIDTFRARDGAILNMCTIR